MNLIKKIKMLSSYWDIWCMIVAILNVIWDNIEICYEIEELCMRLQLHLNISISLIQKKEQSAILRC